MAARLLGYNKLQAYGITHVNTGNQLIYSWDTYYCCSCNGNHNRHKHHDYFSCKFLFIKPTFLSKKTLKLNSLFFWFSSTYFIDILISLIGMGSQRALWQVGLKKSTFSQMTQASSLWTLLFIILGTLLMIFMGYFIMSLILKSLKKNQVT